MNSIISKLKIGAIALSLMAINEVNSTVPTVSGPVVAHGTATTYTGLNITSSDMLFGLGPMVIGAGLYFGVKAFINWYPDFTKGLCVAGAGIGGFLSVMGIRSIYMACRSATA